MEPRHPKDEEFERHLQLAQRPEDAKRLVEHVTNCHICAERLADLIEERGNNFVYDDNASQIYGEHRFAIPPKLR